MTKQFLKDVLGWGIILWLIGYILGIIFFAIMPAGLIGWVIMPIGIIITVWVAFEIIQGLNFRYYLWVGIGWTIIAAVFDYLFLVLLFKPADGYYKLDVYIYYALTLLMPLLAGWRKPALKK